MLPKSIAATEECGFYLALRQAKATGDDGDRIQIPIPTNKNIAFFLVKTAQKAVDGLAQRHIVKAAARVVGIGNALLQLGAELTDQRAAFQAVAITAAVQ